MRHDEHLVRPGAQKSAGSLRSIGEPGLHTIAVVDDGSTSRDQAITNSMDGLQIELVIGLDRDEAHVLAFHGFGDRLCVHEVVLVGLYERLHKLGCNQPHIMALLPQPASEEMRSGTCLQPDQRHLHICGVCQQLPLREFLPHQHLSGYTKRYQVKRCLTKIDANRNVSAYR